MQILTAIKLETFFKIGVSMKQLKSEEVMIRFMNRLKITSAFEVVFLQYVSLEKLLEGEKIIKERNKSIYSERQESAYKKNQTYEKEKQEMRRQITELIQQKQIKQKIGLGSIIEEEQRQMKQGNKNQSNTMTSI